MGYRMPPGGGFPGTALAVVPAACRQVDRCASGGQWAPGRDDIRGTARERIQFNEDTVWTGAPHNYARAGAFRTLPAIRQLLFEGKQKEAEDLAMKEFMSDPLRRKRTRPLAT